MLWQWGFNRSSLEVNIFKNVSIEKTNIVLAALNDHNIQTEHSCAELAVDHSYCDLFNRTSECKGTNDYKEPECREVLEYIRCTFFNVTPGFYCIKINGEDDRCVQHSVFASEIPCTWRSIVKADEGIPDEPEAKLKSVSSFSLSLVVIVTIILLFFIGVIIYMFKRRSPMIPNLDEPNDETIPMVIKKKVLLLYPRDCKQFMTVMKSFGELLEKSLNVEVFDCYNDENALDGPLDWMQNKLRNPQFYVLTVTSHCAYLHQEAILAGHCTYSLYKEPSFLDRVFVYGLRWVMKDISASPFSRNYIIGFRGFSEEEDMLSLPTNWRRYIIPDHLDKLLTDMDINCSPIGNLKNTVQHLNLESDIHSLRTYKCDNPHYLSGILAI